MTLSQGGDKNISEKTKKIKIAISLVLMFNASCKADLSDQFSPISHRAANPQNGPHFAFGTQHVTTSIDARPLGRQSRPNLLGCIIRSCVLSQGTPKCVGHGLCALRHLGGVCMMVGLRVSLRWQFPGWRPGCFSDNFRLKNQTDIAIENRSSGHSAAENSRCTESIKVKTHLVYKSFL